MQPWRVGVVESVQASFESERRARTDVAVEDLGVVADLLDDVHREVGIKPESGVDHRLVLTGRLAQEGLDRRIVAAGLLLHVVRR